MLGKALYIKIISFFNKHSVKRNNFEYFIQSSMAFIVPPDRFKKKYRSLL